MELDVVLVVVLIGISVAWCRVPIPEEVSVSSINHVACEIAMTREAWTTFVYLDHADTELLQCLFNSYRPLYTVNLTDDQRNRNYTSFHIIPIVEGSQEKFTQIEATLRRINILKHFSNYALLFKEPCEQFLEQVFSIFWRNGFVKVIALCPSTKPLIYTYEPFTEDGFKVAKIPPGTDPIYDTLRNFHHFEIKASLFYDPIRSFPRADGNGFTGVDGMLADTVTKHLNATIRYVVPDNNELYGTAVNGTINGALRYIATDLTNIGWNIRYLSENTIPYFESIYPCSRWFFLHLVIPKADLVPQYSNFFRVFDNHTWWLLFFNLIFVACVFMAMQEIALKLPTGKMGVRIRFRQVFGMFFKTAIGDPFDGFHRISSLRQFLLTWVLFSYVVNSIYMAKMESVFIHPAYGNDPDSLSALATINEPIYTQPNFMMIIKPRLHPELYKALLAKYRYLPFNYEAQIRAMTRNTNKRYAFILRRERANLLIARTFDSQTMRPVYHMVKEYFVALPMSYIVTKGSPFLEKFEQITIRCYEHGLTKHWEATSKAEVEEEGEDVYQHATYDEQEDEELVDEDDDENKTVVLTMEILQGAFYFWIIGVGGGCLVFMAELIYWKRSRKQRFDDS